MQDFRKRMTDERQRVYDSARSLEIKAEAFLETGNTDMYEYLSMISRALYKANRNLKQLADDKTDYDYKQAQQSFANTFNAAMAVIQQKTDNNENT